MLHGPEDHRLSSPSPGRPVQLSLPQEGTEYSEIRLILDIRSLSRRPRVNEGRSQQTTKNSFYAKAVTALHAGSVDGRGRLFLGLY